MPPRSTRFVTLVGATALLVGCKGDAKPDNGGPGAAAAQAPLPTEVPVGVPFPSASITALLNPSNLPPYQGATGSVEGTVRVVGPEPPPVTGKNFSACPAAEATYGKLFRVGPPGPGGERPLADAVVAVTEYSGFVVERSDHERVTIGTDCALPQRTITMTFGQRLEITNKSKTVFVPILAQLPHPALLAAPPEETGEPVKLYPPHPGYFTLVDQVAGAGIGQGFISADVYVFLFPTHTVTDLSGHYRIDGIPVGHAKLGARLASIGEVTQPIDILTGVVQKADLVLKYEAKPAAAVDGGGPRIIP